MGFAESLFQKLVTKYIKGPAPDNLNFLSHSARRLEMLAALCLTPSFSPNILSSRKYVGINRTSLYLPELEHLNVDTEMSHKIYTHLILQISAAHNLGIGSRQRYSEIESRIETIKRLPLINRYLDQNFAGFRLLQSDIFEFSKRYSPKSKYLSPLFSFWTSHFLSRHQTSTEVSTQLDFKHNEPIPSFLLVSTSCPEIIEPEKEMNEPPSTPQSQTNDFKKKTELKRRHSSPAIQVDLEKYQNNPIYHSFEKTETAEEYQGERRMDSGDDQLADHSAALEELDLSHVTTGGEAAQSIYQTDGDANGTSISNQINIDSPSCTTYPEWNSRLQKYMIDHCSLYDLPELDKDPLQTFRTTIEQKFTNELKRGREKIAHLVNEPAWKNRLKEGDEIDLDSFTRDYLSLKSHQPIGGRWYAQKRNLITDASIFILFDQSLSSDSWVENKRVLDLFIEAIGIAGILFEDLLPSTYVAGAWSATRHQCMVQTYKTFYDPWRDFFSRIQHIEPQGYTRLGPAIRHATQSLSQEPSRNKLLLLLTDGKPTDLDGYEGSHGINDIRKACLEAETIGITPYALTVDHSGKKTFSKMFRRYKILSQPNQLPIELLSILGQLLGKSK